MRGAGGGEGLLIEVIRSFGSPIVDDKGQPAMDAKKATEAVTWYSELYTKHKAVPPSVTNDSFQQIMTGFTTGQTAMLWHHTGSLIDVSTALGADSGKFGTLVRPSGADAHRRRELLVQRNERSEERGHRMGVARSLGAARYPDLVPGVDRRLPVVHEGH